MNSWACSGLDVAKLCRAISRTDDDEALATLHPLLTQPVRDCLTEVDVAVAPRPKNAVSTVMCVVSVPVPARTDPLTTWPKRAFSGLFGRRPRSGWMRRHRTCWFVT